MWAEGFKIFAGNGNIALAREIVQHLYMDLGQIEVSHFPDGETKVRVLEDVRGQDIFVIQPTCPPANETLMELLIIIDALKRASAERVTAVMPYYGYARQDRKHEGRVPITAKLVANLISVSGADRVLTMDLHATQIQGFFDIPVDHMEARFALVEYLRSRGVDAPVVVSTDVGGLKRAQDYSSDLHGGEIAVIGKRRVGDADVERGHVVGEVAERNVIIVDDMITTAGSMCQAVATAREANAKSVICVATHGLFCGPAWERLAKEDIDEMITTNTVPVDRHQAKAHGLNLKVISVGRLLGEAIRNIHANESVSRLFGFQTRGLSSMFPSFDFDAGPDSGAGRDAKASRLDEPKPITEQRAKV